MTTKVTARTSGIAIATTMPGRQPSDRKLTAEHDGDGLDQRLDELAHGLLDDLRLVGHEMRLDADRQIGGRPWRGVP